jgi:glycosyltransferase involved in cell wall biosynthesis
MHELWVEQGSLAIEQIPAWREISRRFLPEVDHLVTVSDEFLTEVQREHGSLPATVIHSLAPDVEELQTEGAHAAYNIPSTAQIAVHIGTTAPNRNPELGVRALQYLPNYYLIFGATEPPMQERLQSTAASIGVEERIRFTSNDVPRARLEALLTTCSVNLILYGPSQSTKNQMLVLANKIFDGLAAGLPTVAAAGTVSGAYLEREAVGTTFIDDDPVSLADAIRRAESPSLHAAVRARRHDFHWSANRPAIARVVELLTKEQL